VKQSVTDKLLQDFLDHRLSPDAREEFEARLEHEPELARRLEDYRAIGHALRGETEELSPGFYTRARARFEQGPPVESRRWFRLVSWETAGLAAAAILAFALFVPGLLRDDFAPTSTLTDTAVRQSAREGFDDAENRARELDLDAGARAKPDAQSGERLDSVGLLEQGAVADELANVAPVEQAPKDTEQGEDKEFEEVGKALADAPQPTVLDSRLEAEDDIARDVTAESEVVDEKLQRNEPIAAAPRRKRAAAKQEESRDQARDAGRASSAEPAPAAEPDRSYRFSEPDAYFHAAPFEVVELPAGVVSRGAVLTIETAERLNELLRGPAGPALESHARPGTRVVLIGPTDDGLDCASVRIDRETGAYKVRLFAPAGGRGAGSAGCAVILPDDGFRIMVSRIDE